MSLKRTRNSRRIDVSIELDSNLDLKAAGQLRELELLVSKPGSGVFTPIGTIKSIRAKSFADNRGGRS